MKQKWTVLVFFLALLFLSVLSFMTNAQRKEKEVIYGMALNPFVGMTSVLGKGMADMAEIAEELKEELKKKYGFTFTVKKFTALKFLVKAIKEEEVDIFGLPLSFYLYAIHASLPVRPLGVIGLKDKKEVAWCFYKHKDSKIGSIKQLQGKTLVVDFPVFLSKKDALPPKESYIYWVFIKKILLKAGFNKPFSDFFKEFRVLPIPGESVAYAVLLKRFDVFVAPEIDMELFKIYDQGFSDLVPLLPCVDVPVGAGGLYYRERVNPEIVQLAKDIFFSIGKTKTAQKFMKKQTREFKLYVVSGKDFQVFFQWLKEAEQKGWMNEFNAIMTQVMKEKKFKDERFIPK